MALDTSAYASMLTRAPAPGGPGRLGAAMRQQAAPGVPGTSPGSMGPPAGGFPSPGSQDPYRALAASPVPSAPPPQAPPPPPAPGAPARAPQGQTAPGSRSPKPEAPPPPQPTVPAQGMAPPPTMPPWMMPPGAQPPTVPPAMQPNPEWQHYMNLLQGGAPTPTTQPATAPAEAPTVPAPPPEDPYQAMAGAEAVPPPVAPSTATGPGAGPTPDAPPPDPTPPPRLPIDTPGLIGGATQTQAPTGAGGSRNTLPVQGGTPTPAPTPAADQWWQNPSYAGWFTDSGALSGLPLGSRGEDWTKFLLDSGAYQDSAAQNALSNLQQNLSKWVNAQSGDQYNDKAAKKAREQLEINIKNLLKTDWAKQAGFSVDMNALLKNALRGGASIAPAPPPPPTRDDVVGDAIGGRGGGTPGGGTGGTGGTGGDQLPPGGWPSYTEGVDLEDYLSGLNSAAPPEWIQKLIGKHPDAAKIWEMYLDLLKYQEARGDRNQAVDLYEDYGKVLTDDPTRKAMYSHLKDPYLTFSDVDLQKMKAGNAETYGGALTASDNAIREQAARLGIPASDLASYSAMARMGAAKDLAAADRDIDIYGAQTRAGDMERYFGQLNTAQGALLGPLASYYGSLAGLIAGAPGLAQTGNPLAGLAQYQQYDNALSQKPSGYDRRAAIYGEAGGLLNLAGQVAGGFA